MSNIKDYNWLAETLQKLTGIKISQQTVATALNVRQSTIGSRATSGKEFSINELIQIEQAMGLPIGCLSG